MIKNNLRKTINIPIFINKTNNENKMPFTFVKKESDEEFVINFFIEISLTTIVSIFGKQITHLKNNLIKYTMNTLQKNKTNAFKVFEEFILKDQEYKKIIEYKQQQCQIFFKEDHIRYLIFPYYTGMNQELWLNIFKIPL